jgi:hypothetical protein
VQRRSLPDRYLLGSNNEEIEAMKTLSLVRPAVASATVIRAASSASSWVHETLGEQFGLDPIKKNLNLRADWGRKIDAWTVVSDGESPLAVLAESSRGEITAARCLAVEVRSDESVLVLGSAWVDPMGTCIFAETCIQFDGVSKAEADELESALFMDDVDSRFERLSLGTTTIFRRWDDILSAEDIEQRLENDRVLITQLREAGRSFRASFPRVPAGWGHLSGIRRTSIERIDCWTVEALATAPVNDCAWLGDADPLQVTFNIDGIGDQSMLMTARTCMGIVCPAVAAEDADLDLECAGDTDCFERHGLPRAA